MKTKIVLSVVSGEYDIYLAQALIAVYTARKHNPFTEIVLVVDNDTVKVINEKLPKIKEFLSDIIVADVPIGMSKMLRSRYLKTTLRKIIKGDYLFVDTDTVIVGDLSSIDHLDADIAAVLDRHTSVSLHVCRNQIIKQVSLCSLNEKDLRDMYFNSGVMYVKDTPIAHLLYEKWHESWSKSWRLNKGIDQPSLALANKLCGYPIVELNGIWNCQLADNFINYLYDAKILHYFASNHSSPYRLYDNYIFADVMKVGDIPYKLAMALDNPKSYFKEHHQLIYDDDIKFMRSKIHVIFKYHSSVFRMIEYISKVIITRKLW